MVEKAWIWKEFLGSTTCKKKEKQNPQDQMLLNNVGINPFSALKNVFYEHLIILFVLIID